MTRDQTMPDTTPLRQIQCEACRGEGRIYRGVRGGNDPDETSRECGACNGDGWIVEEIQPNEPEDIDDEPPRTTLADGTQIYPEHRVINPKTGQQNDYVVLAEEERAKGFVRPVRLSYVHTKCGGTTCMAQTIAETYARNPFFYGGTFCVDCGAHFPVGEDGEFVWVDGSGQKVGT